MLLDTKASYCGDKVAVKCDCEVAQHCNFCGVRTVNHSSGARHCRVCAGQGSTYEQLLYALCDTEECIKLYAVEAFSVYDKAELQVCDGTTTHVHRKRWDVMTLDPPNLLIEVQGEGHGKKLVTKANNPDSSMAARVHKNRLYAQAAQRMGYSVLWLCVGDAHKSERALAKQWGAALKHAVAHVGGNMPPQLFTA
jgi:hypothetical protein